MKDFLLTEMNESVNDRRGCHFYELDILFTHQFPTMSKKHKLLCRNFQVVRTANTSSFLGEKLRKGLKNINFCYCYYFHN